MSQIVEEVIRMRADINKIRVEKRERLRNLDFFILDNSIRESTLGQLRSHTIEDKIAIYKQIRRCGITDMLVASFTHLNQVDDGFCEWLKDENEDFNQFYSFSEITEGLLPDGTYDKETVPISLIKNKKYGLYNTLFEVNLAKLGCPWGTNFTVNDMCELIKKWMLWVYTNINENARILINLRDLSDAMLTVPEKLLEIVKFLATMPKNIRMLGVTFEDPYGECLPDELAAWTACVRRVMDSNGWSSGKLLVHVHQKWDLPTACQLDCLSAGADGVWASLCDEGAALGHASSSVTLLNLIRLGNTKVLEKYNCTEVRGAAIEVTIRTTGEMPHPKQAVYGERSVDLVFDSKDLGKFNIPEFFSIPCINRISTLAANEIIRNRLVDVFGASEQFTVEIAFKMKEKMLEDLWNKKKLEYMSEPGIALLFHRSGGKLTPEMVNKIAEIEVNSTHHKVLIAEIRQMWDRWGDSGNDITDALQYDSFYQGFMAPYFGDYKCIDTQIAIKTVDVDQDGMVGWREFMLYLCWAMIQYPQTETVNQVMKIAFEEGLIPVLREGYPQNPT